MTHQWRVLLVEDSESARADICFWLEEEGCRVTPCRSMEAAKLELQQSHFHVALVDISLSPQDNRNIDGYRLIEWISKQAAFKDGVLPCIVLTASDRGDLAAEVIGRLPVTRWVWKRPQYRDDLLDAVSTTFAKSVNVNFELGYDDGGEEKLPQMAGHVSWPEGELKPAESLLVEEIRDLLGKRFYDASRVYFRELTKGLSGAAVIRVDAKWDGDYPPGVVLKIGRREKIETEYRHYRKYVKNHLPANTAADAQVDYSGYLGGIQYRFAEDSHKTIPEFDVFFAKETAERVSEALRSLFTDTCRYWYATPDPEFKNLITVYFDALNLSEDKLVTRIGFFLPEFDPNAPRLRLPDQSAPLINPLDWLRNHRDDCTVKVYQSISHGDLTGRNIFVNEQGHCWLIDFFRTYRSHLLRDHAILETDIKYRLLPELFRLKGRDEAYSRDEYERMERALSREQVSDGDEILPEVAKATAAVLTIRGLAEELMGRLHRNEDNIRRQILLSRLITTLNVTRLRHIEPRHKLWALTTAAHICEELDQLPPPR